MSPNLREGQQSRRIAARGGLPPRNFMVGYTNPQPGSEVSPRTRPSTRSSTGTNTTTSSGSNRASTTRSTRSSSGRSQREPPEVPWTFDPVPNSDDRVNVPSPTYRPGTPDSIMNAQTSPRSTRSSIGTKSRSSTGSRVHFVEDPVDDTPGPKKAISSRSNSQASIRSTRSTRTSPIQKVSPARSTRSASSNSTSASKRSKKRHSSGSSSDSNGIIWGNHPDFAPDTRSGSPNQEVSPTRSTRSASSNNTNGFSGRAYFSANFTANYPDRRPPDRFLADGSLWRDDRDGRDGADARYVRNGDRDARSSNSSESSHGHSMFSWPSGTLSVEPYVEPWADPIPDPSPHIPPNHPALDGSIPLRLGGVIQGVEAARALVLAGGEEVANNSAGSRLSVLFSNRSPMQTALFNFLAPQDIRNILASDRYARPVIIDALRSGEEPALRFANRGRIEYNYPGVNANPDNPLDNEEQAAVRANPPDGKCSINNKWLYTGGDREGNAGEEQYRLHPDYHSQFPNHREELLRQRNVVYHRRRICRPPLYDPHDWFRCKRPDHIYR